ncbi:MAG: AAA family ATPase [Myxococcaceae bacterium]
MKRSVNTAVANAPALPLQAEASANPTAYPYRDYAAARTLLESALRDGVFYGLVLGGSGTGKTSLVRELSQTLDRREYQLLYLSTPRVSLLSITRYFAQVLRVTPRRSSLETIKVIADAVQAQPTRLVAWIDEAGSMPVDTLGELRSLAEFSHEVSQIFSVVLSGTPELKSLLDAPPLFPLKRRISLRIMLEGLRRDELDAFLLHRFGSADSRRLPVALRDELFERGRGVPALIDGVARHALASSGKGTVADEHLRGALDAAAL